jgi:type II secretory pathway component PulL
MNHRRESERLNRVMALNTALQHLGIKQHQLAPDRIQLAVRHRCAVIQQQPNKAVRNRDYQQMEEARTVLQNHLQQINRAGGLQLQLFDFTG